MPESEQADNIKEVVATSNGDVSHGPKTPAEYDEFGLLVKKPTPSMPVIPVDTAEDSPSQREPNEEKKDISHATHEGNNAVHLPHESLKAPTSSEDAESSGEEEEYKDARSTPGITTPLPDIQRSDGKAHATEAGLENLPLETQETSKEVQLPHKEEMQSSAPQESKAPKLPKVNTKETGDNAKPKGTPARAKLGRGGDIRMVTSKEHGAKTRGAGGRRRRVADHARICPI